MAQRKETRLALFGCQNQKCVQMTEASVVDGLCNGLPTDDHNPAFALQRPWLLPELQRASCKTWLRGQDAFLAKKLRLISEQNCSTAEASIEGVLVKEPGQT